MATLFLLSFWLLNLWPSLAIAGDEFVLDFSSRTQRSKYTDPSSTALWNPAEGRIQAPYSALNSGIYSELPFSHGEDGAFLNGPIQANVAFTKVGNIVSVDTDLQPTDGFSFSSFRLDAAYTLRVRGTQSLIIRVTDTMTVAGLIEADGMPGEDNTVGAGAGGEGGPGGFPGGAGSPAAAAGADTGLPAFGNALGGGGGTSGANGGGGGGGCVADFVNGAFDSESGQAAGAGLSANCAKGSLGVVQDFDLTGLHGGGGGGGGGGIASTKPGPGGGGGGGAIRLIAMGDLQISGSITVRGGKGGDYPDVVNATTCAGGGGGGSGGTVWLQAGGTINGGGSIDVSRGEGGESTPCSTAQNGGAGSQGILRTDDRTGSAPTTVTIQPTALADSFTTQVIPAAPSPPYVFISKIFDFSDGYYRFGRPIETLGCGTDGNVSIRYQGSNDGTTFGALVEGASIGDLDESAYLRMRVEITPGGANPPCLTGLRIPYDARSESKFLLSGAGLFCGSAAYTNRNLEPKSGDGSHFSRSSKTSRDSDGRTDLVIILLISFFATRAGGGRRSQNRIARVH